MFQSTNPLDHITGPVQLKRPSIRDLVNGVRGTFISPSNNWQSSDFPAYAQDPDHGYPVDQNLIDDGGDRRWLDIQLPFTISSSMAQRLASIELRRRRYMQSAVLPMDMVVYNLAPLDVIKFSFEPFGWTDKLFEIASFKLTSREQDNNAPVLGCEIELQETDPSIYDWNVSEELAADGAPQLAVTGSSTTAALSSVGAVSDASTSFVGPDGIARSRILVSFTAPVGGFAQGGQIQVRYMAQGALSWAYVPGVDASVSQVYINDVVYGQTYTVEARVVNVAGIASPWSSPVTVIAAGASSQIPASSINGLPTFTVNGK